MKESHVSRVSGGTNHKKLAASLVVLLTEEKVAEVDMVCIGPHAVNQAMKACIQANATLDTLGHSTDIKPYWKTVATDNNTDASALVIKYSLL